MSYYTNPKYYPDYHSEERRRYRSRRRRNDRNYEPEYINESESVEYSDRPFQDRRQRRSRGYDHNYIQNIGHDMKQAWDRWARDGNRVDDPSRDRVRFPNEKRYGYGDYENARSHGSRGEAPVYYENAKVQDRRYLNDDRYYDDRDLYRYSNEEEDRFSDDNYEIMADDRRMGMNYLHHNRQGKFLHKYRRRK
jgi:hypothetical protein